MGEKMKRLADLNVPITKDNVLQAICEGIESYNKKHRNMDALFWTFAISILASKYGFTKDLVETRKALREESDD